MGNKVWINFSNLTDWMVLIIPFFFLLQTSRYLTGCFYADTSWLLEKQYEGNAAAASATSTLQAAVNNAGNKGQWLVLMRPQGVMEVCRPYSTTTIWVQQRHRLECHNNESRTTRIRHQQCGFDHNNMDSTTTMRIRQLWYEFNNTTGLPTNTLIYHFLQVLFASAKVDGSENWLNQHWYGNFHEQIKLTWNWSRRMLSYNGIYQLISADKRMSFFLIRAWPPIALHSTRRFRTAPSGYQVHSVYR